MALCSGLCVYAVVFWFFLSVGSVEAGLSLLSFLFFKIATFLIPEYSFIREMFLSGINSKFLRIIKIEILSVSTIWNSIVFSFGYSCYIFLGGGKIRSKK